MKTKQKNKNTNSYQPLAGPMNRLFERIPRECRPSISPHATIGRGRLVSLYNSNLCVCNIAFLLDALVATTDMCLRWMCLIRDCGQHWLRRCPARLWAVIGYVACPVVLPVDAWRANATCLACCGQMLGVQTLNAWRVE